MFRWYSWQGSYGWWGYVVFEALEHRLVDNVQCSGAALKKGRRRVPKTIQWSSQISRVCSQCCFQRLFRPSCRIVLRFPLYFPCFGLPWYTMQFHTKQCTVHIQDPRDRGTVKTLYLPLAYLT